MGLIAARPEDPEQWAGIPSEPRDADADARGDTLADPTATADDALGLLGGSALESIVIAVPVAGDLTPEKPVSD